ncbi:CACTA en-spm transposon protein [Cucumis melo var. makuwa]|uniref:CACTA en-spm transposon protein n=1 Tax=Cucumis melo var. makuwa TaxID=1194695 RepID=A0A5A7UDH1_CUCMM|nr:CACTA en-spm transposon protein [Cucumis melo var. makuwa]TYK11559.1 CACTA en-spm transposon protein [Cucumis melo var. makuwa]
MPEGNDVENEQLNVLKIVVSHWENGYFENDILYRPDVDPTVVKRSVVYHLVNDFIDVGIHIFLMNVYFYISTTTMLSFPSGFKKTDAMFLEFGEDLNTTEGLSSVGNNSKTTRHSSILGVEEFSEAISMCTRCTFPVRCLRCIDVEREYIEHRFMFDFNDQAMNRLVAHQMVTSFTEFKGDCHRHFKRYSSPEQLRVNPSHILVGRMEDWHFLFDHNMSRAFQVRFI